MIDKGRKGGSVVAFSKKLADMARDATISMTDNDVLRATGLSYATWHRILAGNVPGVDKLMALATGLNLDPEPFLAVAVESRGAAIDSARIMQFALKASGLDSADTFKVMQLYRQLLEQQDARGKNEAAA